MTVVGVIVLDLAVIALLTWVLDLVRRGRLYVGYGVVFAACLTTVAVMITVPGLLRGAAAALAILFPSAPLVVIALGGFVVLVIYAFVQITVLANRLASVVQALAIENAHRDRRSAQASPGRTEGNRG